MTWFGYVTRPAMPPPSSEQSFRANLSQFRWARGTTDDSQPIQQPSNPFSRFYNTLAGDYIPLRSSERSNEDEAWFALSSWERSVPPPPPHHRAHLPQAARIRGMPDRRRGLFLRLLHDLAPPRHQVRPSSPPLRPSNPLHTDPPNSRSPSGKPNPPPFLTISPSAALEVCSSCSGPSPFRPLSQHPHISPLDSFSVLIGPINHFKHLISTERLPFSVTYFASLALTLYFSLGVRPSALILPFSHTFYQPKSYLGSILSGAVQVVALVAYVLAYFPGGTQTIRLGGQLALRGAGSILPR